MGSTTEIAILHQPKHKNPFDSPYTLILEYKYLPHGGKNHEIESSCPQIDIRVILEPSKFAREAIKCSDDELKHAKDPRP
jgi:hypothetical protein